MKHLFRSVFVGVFSVFALVFVVSCSPISNIHNTSNLECSLPLLAGQQIFKISGFDPSLGIEVTFVRDNTFEMSDLPLNPKGCFALPSELKGHLVLRGLERSELRGTVYSLPFLDEASSIVKLVLGRIQTSNVYPRLCENKAVQYTSRNHFDFEVPSGSLSADHFFVVESRFDGRLTRRIFAADPVALYSVDELKDGKNDLVFDVYDLLQSKKVMREENCSVVVDTLNPAVLVKRSDGITLADGDALFAPGERIYLSGEESSTLNYCLHGRDGQAEDQCSVMIGSGFITLPQGGRWTLLTTVVDLAGNRHSESQPLTVYNKTAVSLIRAQARSNSFGSSRSSLGNAADLERDRLALFGRVERDELENETKAAMLSALGRSLEKDRKAFECSPGGVTFLTKVGERLVFLSEDSSALCIYQVDGTFLLKIKNPLPALSLSAPYQMWERAKPWKTQQLVFYTTRTFIFVDLISGDVKTVAVSEDILEFDVDQIHGTVFAIETTKPILHKIEFDGQSHAVVEMNIPSAVRFDHVVYLPFASGPKLFFQWEGRPVYQDKSLLCDLTLSDCSSDKKFARDDQIVLSPDLKWFAVVRGTETKIWSLDDSTLVSVENAIRVQGTFSHFLEDEKFATTGFQTWGIWQIGNDLAVDLVMEGGQASASDPLFLHYGKEGATLFGSQSISRWSVDVFSDHKSKLIDRFSTEGSTAITYAGPGKNPDEYVVFSPTEIIRYNLRCLCAMNLFTGGSAALQQTAKTVTYSNASGQRVTYNGTLLGMSPEKNFALVQERLDEGETISFLWHLIAKDGSLVSTTKTEGHISNNPEIVSAKGESLVMALDSDGVYMIFETGVKNSVYNLNFSGETRRDVFLSTLKATVVSKYRGGIEIYNYETDSKRFIADSTLVSVGKSFPFVAYKQNNNENVTQLVIENLETGRRHEWPAESVTSFDAKIEKCDALFINQKGISSHSLLIDLKTFDIHSYDLMEKADCGGLIPHLTLSKDSSDQRGTESFTIDEAYSISPAIPYWLQPLGLDKYYGRESMGKAVQLYDQAGTLLSSYSIEGKDFRGSYGAYFPEGYVYLEDESKPEDFEYLDANFKPYIVPNKKPIQRLGNFQNMGRLLWLEDRDLLIDTDLENQKNPKFVAIPTTKGVKFLPLDNASLLKLIDQEIQSTTP